MLHFPRWKILAITLMCLVALLFSLPSFVPEDKQEMLSWIPARKMNLGLDLRGGSHLLLEVDDAAYWREHMESLVDEVRGKLRKEKVGYTQLGVAEGEVRFTLRDEAEKATAEKALRDLATGLELRVDGLQFALFYGEAAKKEKSLLLIEQSIEIVRRRVDETGTREPIIQRQGTSRIVLQVPGLDNPEHLKEILGRTAKMTFHLVDTTTIPEDAKRGLLPAGTVLMPAQEGDSYQKEYVVQRRAILSGDLLTGASATFDQGQPVVSFTFNTIGARKFGEVTQANVGKPFAIVLDGKVISAPVIREPIIGGSGIISGNFDVQSANDLALLLRAGALPAPLKVVEERTVGPSLGNDSIEAGKMASILGVVLVMAFMVLCYGLFGVFANIALLVNLVLIIALLAFLQATLTLPGIAGIVLTMGMSVDANVLIYERIREELRLGKTILASIEAGFKRAFGTIFDSHFTNLIAAILLFYLGSGTVKGFAVTLIIGIITSLFTATLFTRMIVVTWIRSARPKTLSI